MQPLTIIFTLVILFGLFYVFNNGRPTKKETTTGGGGGKSTERDDYDL